MTVFIIGPTGHPKPNLKPVPDETPIPMDVSQPRAVQHARRVAHLTRAWSLARPKIAGREAEEFGDIMPIGIALSWALDLGIIGDVAVDTHGSISSTVIHEAAFPVGGGSRMRAALSADAPRYEPESRFWDHSCPIPGPRGGKCASRPRRSQKWVTDTENGAWEWRDVCRHHEAVALDREHAAPYPRPNRGGVVEAVFPEVDTDVLYAWARPHWAPLGAGPAVEPVVMRRRFRVVVGGEA